MGAEEVKLLERIVAILEGEVCKICNGTGATEGGGYATGCWPCKSRGRLWPWTKG